MFYSVASPEWMPGQAMSPTGALLFRTRSEAAAFAPMGRTVAVAVRFDSRRAEVRPQGPVAQMLAGGWASAAVENTMGGLTVFEPIPASLVRPLIEGETMADWRPRLEDDAATSSTAGVGVWDSITMALIA